MSKGDRLLQPWRRQRCPRPRSSRGRKCRAELCQLSLILLLQCGRLPPSVLPKTARQCRRTSAHESAVAHRSRGAAGRPHRPRKSRCSRPGPSRRRSRPGYRAKRTAVADGRDQDAGIVRSPAWRGGRPLVRRQGGLRPHPAAGSLWPRVQRGCKGMFLILPGEVPGSLHPGSGNIYSLDAPWRTPFMAGLPGARRSGVNS